MLQVTDKDEEDGRGGGRKEGRDLKRIEENREGKKKIGKKKRENEETVKTDSFMMLQNTDKDGQEGSSRRVGNSKEGKKMGTEWRKWNKENGMRKV